MIRCPTCGKVLIGAPHTTIKPCGKRYQYPIYRCRYHYSYFQCSFKKFVNQNVLERLLLKDVERLLEEEKVRATNINASAEDKPKYNLESLKEQVRRLNYSWQTGKILDLEDYETQYNKLMSKIKEAKAETQKNKKKDFTRIENILTDGWQEMYKTLSPTYKLAFWRSIIKNIEVDWETDQKQIHRIIFF